MNIVVLAGGLSTEREVSLSSGSMVAAALRRAGHKAVLVDAFFGLDNVPDPVDKVFDEQADSELYSVKEQAPDLAEVKAQRADSGLGEIGKNVIEVCRAADIVYMGLHGDNGENGRMQAFFDVLGIRYTGAGYLSSSLAMNKSVAKDIFLQNGISTPKGKSYRKGDDMGDASSFGFPCIVKPCCGGSSIGIAKAADQAELDQAIADAFDYEDEIIVEEFVTGREFSVGVLGDMVLPPIEIIPRGGFYDYAHKYQAGWTEEVCPANLDEVTTKKMQALTMNVFCALRLEVYARGEFILDDKGGMYCLEMNTLPGMTPTSLLPQEAAAVGIGYEELCEKIIAISLGKYGE